MTNLGFEINSLRNTSREAVEEKLVLPLSLCLAYGLPQKLGSKLGWEQDRSSNALRYEFTIR
jgi:hypothetical protein